jgi:hypothetical protein
MTCAVASAEDVVLKKMLYLYISTYAQANPDLTLLTINLLTKDCRDQDPTIRGLALRSLCQLRVANLVEYLVRPGRCAALPPRLDSAAGARAQGSAAGSLKLVSGAFQPSMLCGSPGCRRGPDGTSEHPPCAAPPAARCGAPQGHGRAARALDPVWAHGPATVATWARADVADTAGPNGRAPVRAAHGGHGRAQGVPPGLRGRAQCRCAVQSRRRPCSGRSPARAPGRCSSSALAPPLPAGSQTWCSRLSSTVARGKFAAPSQQQAPPSNERMCWNACMRARVPHAS